MEPTLIRLNWGRLRNKLFSGDLGAEAEHGHGNNDGGGTVGDKGEGYTGKRYGSRGRSGI